MNLKGNLTSKGLQGSIGKSRMQGILGTNPAAIPITVDNALSLSSTNPVQNRVITAAITNRLWSDEVKTALLQIAQKVAYIDADGQDYYDALYDALYPPVGLDSIGAVLDSSATIYNTDTLDDLKQYLVVTAYYTNGDSEVVTTYTLSGSMDAGTQTITVAYGGKTTTFSVTVVEWLVSIDAVFTQGSAAIYDSDSLDTLRQYLVVTATYADSTTETVTDYTLSGTLTAGTSTITVSYGGKIDAFDVTVTESGLIYSLYNRTFNKSVAGVDSGLKLCENNTSFTILFDGVQISNTNGNRLFLCLQPASPYKGIYVGSTNSSGNNKTEAQWFSASNNIGFGKTSSGRIRILYSHEANSREVTVSWKSNSGVTTFTLTNAFVSHTSTLIVASAGTGDWAKENTWVGTLTKFEVYNRVLSQSEIDAFFG